MIPYIPVGGGVESREEGRVVSGAESRAFPFVCPSARVRVLLILSWTVTGARVLLLVGPAVCFLLLHVTNRRSVFKF